jgi:hypothetical protein
MSDTEEPGEQRLHGQLREGVREINQIRMKTASRPPKIAHFSM